MKKKIIIYISDIGSIQKFIGTESFQNIEEKFDITYIIKQELSEAEHVKPIKINSVSVDFRQMDYPSRKLLKKLFAFRAAKYSTSYAFSFYRPDGTFKRRYPIYKIFTNYPFLFTVLRGIHKYVPIDIFRLLAKSLIYELFVLLSETLIPCDNDLDTIFKKLSPSGIIIVSATYDIDVADIVQCARGSKIKWGVIPIGWDNLSSKFLSFIRPDFVFERGKDNAELAKRIFGLNNNRVKIVGVPHYEPFLKYQKMPDRARKREDYLADLNISSEKTVFLFGGSLRPFDEGSFLELLNEAIQKDILPNVHVIYRPHPERDERISEKSFFDQKLGHVTFDDELLFAYRNHKSGYQPELEKFSPLYNAIDAMISPYSTVISEAALFGKPVLGLGCDDGYHYGVYGPVAMANREHFKKIKEFYWFIDCIDKQNFVIDCKKLLELASQPEILKQIKEDMKSIIFSDQRSYALRIHDALVAVTGNSVTQ